MVTTTLPETRSIPQIASRLRLAVVRTARRLRQDAYEAEGRVTLSPTLTAALATVDGHGPLTPSELADRERVRRPTATRIVANLVEQGLVTRTPDPDDGRGFLVASTPAGRATSARGRRTGRRRTIGPPSPPTRPWCGASSCVGSR